MSQMGQKPSIERPPRSPLSISVFFPCYNEEANVVRTTEAALAAVRKLSDDFEIIIVDDGSKDGTPGLADDLAKTHAEVRAVHNVPNRGYGGALQRGFTEATKPWVFYTDGDGQFDFEELGKVLPLLDEYDIVSAYRIDRQDPWFRKLFAWGWTTVVNLLLGLRLRDIDCAFKMFPRRLFDEIKMKSNGALIDGEVLSRASRLGYSIGQIGVRHYPRVEGEQSGANIRVIFRAFRELFALRRDIRRTSRR